MMTRKNTARDSEQRLKTALLELQASKQQCQQLLEEREESELEVERIVEKNTQLKNDLAELDIICEDLRGQRDELQRIVHKYDQCRDTHEVALQRIKLLEHQLSDAHKELQVLRQQNLDRESENILSMYNELISDNSSSNLLVPAKSSQSLVPIQGANRIKRYIRAKRHIKRINKALKNNTEIVKYMGVKKINVSLQKDLLSSTMEYAVCSSDYEVKIKDLHSHIHSLEHSLHDLGRQFTEAQEEMNEYAAELTAIGNYNE